MGGSERKSKEKRKNGRAASSSEGTDFRYFFVYENFTSPPLI